MGSVNCYRRSVMRIELLINSVAQEPEGSSPCSQQLATGR
jgi:hypothetical protein